MKILQVNCVYKNGSTGKIVYDIHSELIKKGEQSVVCYGRGANVSEENVYKTCSEVYSDINHFFANLTGVLYGGCFFSTNKLIGIIKKEKPDVVHLHCLNGFFVNIYRVITWLKKNNIKTVLTLHAEFMYTGGCGHAIDCNQWSINSGCGHSKCPRYRSDMKVWFFDRSRTMWKRMKNAFDGFNNNLIITSVSPWLMERAKQSPVMCDKVHKVVFNGVNTDVFHSYDTNDLRMWMGLSDEKIIFHATPTFNNDANHIKGGHYVLRLAEKMQNENVKFVIAGAYSEGLKVPSNVILLGKITDQTTLAKYYSMADVTLLTSKKETFSMVVAESLCCGTPVVGFKAGAPEQIAIPEYSDFVEYGDVDLLNQATKALFAKSYSKKEIELKAQRVYSKATMTKNYLNIYKEILD